MDRWHAPYSCRAPSARIRNGRRFRRESPTGETAAEEALKLAFDVSWVADAVRAARFGFGKQRLHVLGDHPIKHGPFGVPALVADLLALERGRAQMAHPLRTHKRCASTEGATTWRIDAP